MAKRAVGDRGLFCHQTVLRRLPRSCRHFRRDAIPFHPIQPLLWTIKWEDRRRKTIEDAIHDLISVRMRANAAVVEAGVTVTDRPVAPEYDASPLPPKTFTSESFFLARRPFLLFYSRPSFLPSFFFAIQFLSVAQRGERAREPRGGVGNDWIKRRRRRRRGKERGSILSFFLLF